MDNVPKIPPAPDDWFLPIELGLGVLDIYRRKQAIKRPPRATHHKSVRPVTGDITRCPICRALVYGECLACHPPQEVDLGEVGVIEGDPTEAEIAEAARKIREEGYTQKRWEGGKPPKKVPPWTEEDYRLRAGESTDGVEIGEVRLDDFPEK